MSLHETLAAKQPWSIFTQLSNHTSDFLRFAEGSKRVIRTHLNMRRRPPLRERETQDHRSLKITFDDNLVARSLFGERNQHLRQIAHVLAIQIHARGNAVTIHGDTVTTQLAEKLLNELYALIE